jgi:hypothetical protein
MNIKTDQGKQIRLTLEDALKYQENLKQKLKLLISENRALKYTERKQFFELLTKALLSQGATDPCYFVYNQGWFIFESVQTLAHRIADLNTNKVRLKTTRPKQVEIVLPIGELWSFLYRKMLYLFPQASAEAIHISAESVEKPKQGSYKFSSRGDLE